MNNIELYGTINEILDLRGHDREKGQATKGEQNGTIPR